ncbi:TPA: phage tail protein [Salmonella enterica subsp. enterica serovar Concord]|uniref:Phage tail protein n=2 Tax=Salmonella enterica TaxID=28901 RepID=A0A737IIZ7_SALET|nr:phage tail protein [Salmonella enterica]ECK9766016.1 phage tail protein [Salmonella enterica subsp. enterica serovar Concord]HAE8242249.1 phage tail protein [Salmonella enterica subsp. enterica serovar Concord]HAF7367981.1 phage tail protein [Salmonella enterica subsp. enterica serovar Concord]HCL1672447.1 phage tail protein [Salmonella enterica subsp. enterica serovar Concord]HDO8207377.1 phage tail protein [Salmonella enterica subsp. enterica serovar Concord]
MSTKFKTVITTAGAVKLAAATMPGGKKINLNVMAVGDGGGKLPVPDAGQTQLVNEVWRHTLNKISQDNRYSNYIVAELVIPPEVGGFWMRELGLYDDEGTLIAVANMAESYKPELAEGSGRAQTCRMVIIVSSVESVELSIDSTMVMATQDYVDDRLAEHEKSRRHPDATLKEKGFTQLSNATDSESETLAATPKAVKTAYDLANAKYTAQDATTARKGIIQLSNATDSTSETLAATPKAVKAAMDNANGRVPSDRKVNGHPLSGDITLWASDVKAISADAIGQITDNGTMASANTPGWWRVAVSNSDTVADFPTYPDGSKLYSYGYLFVEKIGEVWFQHYYAHMGANAKRQDWGTEPNTSRQWVIDYNTVNKPSASDVGALPITGGRLNGPLGIGTDNALGGNSIVFGDNDTGFKWHSDGVLGIYANSAQVGYIDNSGLHMLADIRATGVVRTGNGKTLTLSSGNNSALNAGLSLWGGGERPTVIELSDEQGWHLYSQRNTDGSISFTVNGIVYCNALNIGGAIYQNNGDIFGSLWGNGWLSTWIHNNVVKAVRLGPVALSGGLWRDFQLGGGQVVTGFHTDGSWEMEGGDDKVYYRPIQYLVGDTWVTAPSV